jgi:hypothetical protein
MTMAVLSLPPVIGLVTMGICGESETTKQFENLV